MKPAPSPSPTRRRSWGEHPLSIPANLSWTLLALFLLALVPIAELPALPWWIAGAWLLVNVGISAVILRGREVPVEPSRPQKTGEESELVEGTSLFRDAMRRLRRNQLATLSAGVIVVTVLLCFGHRIVYEIGKSGATGPAPDSFFALHIDYIRINKEESFAPPDRRHWFGTDALGRDLFARTLFGGHISVIVGVVATAISLLIGVTWGAIAGYFGGRVDHYMMRLVDVLYGLPFMFLVILILTLVNGLHSTAAKYRDAVDTIAALERDGKFEEAAAKALEVGIADDLGTVRTAVWLADRVSVLHAMFLALGAVSWLTMARITRGQVLSIAEREFVVAARTIGAGNLRIIFRHVVPNVLGPVIVYTTLTIPAVILAEAFLSFLGLGISQPDCSWGSLASEGLAGINVIKPYWWLMVYPAVALSLSLFSLNFIGDGLRDALDPKMKR